MSGWLTFFKERIPLLSYLFLTAGITTSASFLMAGRWEFASTADGLPGILAFFLCSRLIQEWKHLPVDRVVYPDRALARGVLSEREVVSTIRMSLWVLAGYGCFLALGSIRSGLVYLCLPLFLFLETRDFFASAFLRDHPLIFGLTRRLAIFLVAGFALVVAAPTETPVAKATWYGAFLYGAFVTYDAACQFNPGAHPLLKTYRQLYGPQGAGIIILGTMLLSAVAAYNLQVHWHVWTIQAVTVFITFFVPLTTPMVYRSIELAAAICLGYHVWAPTLAKVL